MPSIFIGYPFGQKGYKLFDLSTKKVFTSRDVKFHETIFPYSSIQPSHILPSQAHKPGPLPISSFIDFSFTPPSHNTRASSSTPTPTLTENTTSTSDPTPSSPDPVSSSPTPPPAPPSLLQYSRRPKATSVPPHPSMPTSPPSSPPVAPALPPLVSHPSAPPSSPILSDSPAEPPFPSPEITPEPAAPLRRSSRHPVQPVKFNDYVCSHVCSDQSSSLHPGPRKGTRYPLANYISYHRYKPAYQHFVAQISASTEPKNYSEAVAHPEWRAAMATEL
uniref:vegetative cell wall protein gp1-like n=1 Tax=Fragaria vesca subsp. vesca TaxID=101020 RepID=UPI0005C946F9|nr:PREDICTED: vegetative cell wall protein gp1-like [Fragaria vesca subsp. vesca]